MESAGCARSLRFKFKIRDIFKLRKKNTYTIDVWRLCNDFKLIDGVQTRDTPKRR